MGLKAWAAKKTSTPKDYAWAFASGLAETIDYLAASVVVFSGSRAASAVIPRPTLRVFASHFDMESAGFEPLTKDVAVLLAPDLRQAGALADAEICQKAFKATAAFLCLLSENEARRYMKPQNASMFSNGLYAAVATCCAGRFGLHSEPREVWAEFHSLVPAFRCERIVNRDEFGRSDGLGALLLGLSASEDGRTEYGSVTGSRNQSLGCATALVKVLLEVNERLRCCAKDLDW